MVFVLASVLGYCLVMSVKPSLHTPLMSMSNAISGIVVLGGTSVRGCFTAVVARGLLVAAGSRHVSSQRCCRPKIGTGVAG